MRGVGLRRQQRQSTKQTDAGESNAPVSVIFRSHTDGLSTAPFLFCPRNFNLPMPTAQMAFTEEVIELRVPNGPGDPHLADLGGSGSSHTLVPHTAPNGAAGAHVFGGGGECHSGASSNLLRATSPLQASMYGSPDSLSRSFDSSALNGANARATTTMTVPSSLLESPLNPPTGESGKESWICRAYCFGEKDAVHTNGAISVHHSVANKIQFINDIAKGKATARVMSSYAEARDRFGLSHVELTFEACALYRADMFIIAESLREHILYEGQEIALSGVRVKVRELLRSVTPISTPHIVEKGTSTVVSAGATPEGEVPSTTLAVGTPNRQWTPLLTFQPTQPQQPMQMQLENTDVRRNHRCVCCGLVTSETLVNFRSLSPKLVIILEISKEMWNTTLDGRIVLTWAVKKFLREYFLEQLPKHKATPSIFVVIVGRLHPQYAMKGELDIAHMMTVANEFRTENMADEMEEQYNAFLKCLMRELRAELLSRDPSFPVDELTERDIFVNAKETSTMKTLSVVLEHFEQVDKGNVNGFLVTIVSAGKGLYQVTRDALKDTCIRLFNFGIDKINIVCIGRPPLHVTPLLEYVNEDESPLSPHSASLEGQGQRLYERPEWARCLFYHPAPDGPRDGVPTFDLLTREEWLRRQRVVQGRGPVFVPGLGLPSIQLPSVLLPVLGDETTMCHAPGAAPNATTTTSVDARTVFRAKGGVERTATASLETGVTDGALFLFATWYAQRGRGGSPGRHYRSGREMIHNYAIMRHAQNEDRQICCRQKGKDMKRTHQTASKGVPVSADFVSSGVNVLDSDLQSGHVLLELRVNAFVLPNTSWSPGILSDDIIWGQLMNAFAGKHSCCTAEEAEYFTPHFRSSEVFCRDLSAIMGEGKSLILATHPSNVSFTTSEDVVFSYRTDFFVTGLKNSLVPPPKQEIPLSEVNHAGPLNPDGGNLTVLDAEANTEEEDSRVVVPLPIAEPHLVDTAPSGSGNQMEVDRTETTHPAPPDAVVTVARIRIRSHALFAIQPINPYASMTTESPARTSHIASTAVLFRRRWFFTHPDAPTSAWTTLCHCKMLPLYGTKPTYARDSYYDVPTHHYAVSTRDRTRLLEYVLQRLVENYQIVVEGTSLASVQWPRGDPTPNVRVDMSIGHQIHHMKVGETGQSLSVTRMMHRGMYSNAPVTQVMTHSYLLLNYLSGGFSVREAPLAVLIGEKFTFCWEDLDTYLRERPDATIPRSPTCRLREKELCIVLLPESVESKPISFEVFLKLIKYRFSSQLITHGDVHWVEDDTPLHTSIPDEMDYPDLPSLFSVVLLHDHSHKLDHQCVLDHKTGRTISLDAPADNRMIMSIDVSLPLAFNPRCHYLLRITWMVCIPAIVIDWYWSFFATAARFGFRAVPMVSYEKGEQTERRAAAYTVHADDSQDEPRLRRTLLTILTTPQFGYYPAESSMSRNCRLLHISGLCYVRSKPDPTIVAQWYENPEKTLAQLEHQRLLTEFVEAEQRARVELRGGVA